MSGLLNGTGIVLEILGLAVAGYGAYRTWTEWAPDERFAAPAIAAFMRLRRRVMATAQSVYRWALRRPPRAIAIQGQGAVAFPPPSSKGRLRVQFRSIPEGRHPAWVVKELDERTRRLMEIVSDLQDSTEDRVEGIRRDIAEHRGRTDVLARQVRGDTRRVAVGGLRLEAVGLMVAAFGLVLQLSGVLIG